MPRPLADAVTFLTRLLVIALGAGSLPAQPPRSDRFGIEPTLVALRGHVRATGDADRTVAGSAWLVQAFLATRSTMRSGAARAELKLLAVWLRTVQDQDGRFAPGGTPCPRGDQLLAAMAMCELGVQSNYRLLIPTWQRAANATAVAFEAADAVPATPDEAALLAQLANSLEWAAGEHDLAGRVRRLVQPTAEARTARVTRREDAGRMLARELLRAVEPADLIAAVVWPPDLAADPLHTYFAVNALTPHRAQLARYVEPLRRLAAARMAPGGDGALWPAAAGLDAVTTSAMLTTVLATADARLPVGDDQTPK